MADLADGEKTYVQGSGKEPYELKNVGGVYSCSCPAWRNAGGAIDRRTCKHLKKLRGEDVELARVGEGGSAARPSSKVKTSTEADAAGVGPPLLLAHRWDGEDLAGWWMSEKLDGVRAYWDGERFVSRLGNAFVAPAYFIEGLPAHPLDGELWLARGEFQACVSIVRRADGGEHWKKLRYLVFDAPAHQGSFEQRLEHVRGALGEHPYAALHPHEKVRDVAHLRAELARVEQMKGEGLMLRKPGSKYEVGRSTTLLKVKTFHDAEGTVIGHEPGKGKHKGRVGALIIRAKDGTKFSAGTGLSDAERKAPPPIGSLVTYRYQELTKDGVPRFPSYVGPAIDKK